MSAELEGVWESRINPDRCKTPYLVDYLEELGLLGAGYAPIDPDDDLELRGRDDERVRLVKRISTAPEGIMLKTLVSEVIKGQPVGECERFDGSDPDYQFVYRFTRDLARCDPSLIEKRKTAGSLMVTPTIRLLDLISEGITQTKHVSDDILYDRTFCKNYLKMAHSVDDWGQDLLEDSLHRYLKRIENYQLLFDVHFCGRRGGDTSHRMTKDYKTRFNSQGRIDKTWARFNQSLEFAYERYDNAVLMTLTTDPGTYEDPTRPNPRPLFEGIDTINPNFNRLLSYFDTDPQTKADTRIEGVPSWSPTTDSDVTGRPRHRPPYLKALEFTEKGYPHLHVLMFDVPTRESDGMPFLIDKDELSKKWKDYGQGQIVDLYPLVFRDDLDEVGNFGTKNLVSDEGDEYEVPVSKGFVDWYRYGDHNHDQEWIENRARSHELIDFYESDENDSLQSRTAGSYLGKYLSATFGSLRDAASESFDDAREGSYADKAATWKLGLYWATGRRFWSISKDIEQGIERTESIRDNDVRQAVRELSIDSISLAAEGPILEELTRTKWPNSTEELKSKLDDVLENIVTPEVESSLPPSSDFYAFVDYLGCYAYWDMPTADATSSDLDLVEDYVTERPSAEPDVLGDRPPPVSEVWE